MDDYYGAIAPGYDALYGAEQDGKLHSMLSRVTIPPGSRVLDVGCGTGRSARFFALAKWQGIDPCEGLIAMAPPDVRDRIALGAGEMLPFADACFDVVVSVTALQNFADARAGLLEMRRVCAPGGMLLISFLMRGSGALRLDGLVRELLAVRDAWEDGKDVLYICTRA